MLYVALKPEQKCGNTPSSYRPNLDETATSLDELGLGVHLYWAMEFEADGAKFKNEDILGAPCAPASVLPDLRGHFAGGSQPYGWATTRSFVDPALTEASTTDLFGLL